MLISNCAVAQETAQSTSDVAIVINWEFSSKMLDPNQD